MHCEWKWRDRSRKEGRVPASTRYVRKLMKIPWNFTPKKGSPAEICTCSTPTPKVVFIVVAACSLWRVQVSVHIQHLRTGLQDLKDMLHQRLNIVKVHFCWWKLRQCLVPPCRDCQLFLARHNLFGAVALPVPVPQSGSFHLHFIPDWNKLQLHMSKSKRTDVSS